VAEGVFDGGDALGGGGVGEHGEAVDVADGVNAGDVGGEVGVDFYAAAFKGDAGIFEAEAFA
jgi:hypothetical protein